MKISNASKKVLASALSAAMVVAFAPTAAFGAQNSQKVTVKFDLAGGVDTASNPQDALASSIEYTVGGVETVTFAKATGSFDSSATYYETATAETAGAVKDTTNGTYYVKVANAVSGSFSNYYVRTDGWSTSGAITLPNYSSIQIQSGKKGDGTADGYVITGWKIGYDENGDGDFDDDKDILLDDNAGVNGVQIDVSNAKIIGGTTLTAIAQYASATLDGAFSIDNDGDGSDHKYATVDFTDLSTTGTMKNSSAAYIKVTDPAGTVTQKAIAQASDKIVTAAKAGAYTAELVDGNGVTVDKKTYLVGELQLTGGTFSGAANGTPDGYDTAVQKVFYEASATTGVNYATALDSSNKGTLNLNATKKIDGTDCIADYFVDANGNKSTTNAEVKSVKGGVTTVLTAHYAAEGATILSASAKNGTLTVVADGFTRTSDFADAASVADPSKLSGNAAKYYMVVTDASGAVVAETVQTGATQKAFGGSSSTYTVDNVAGGTYTVTLYKITPKTAGSVADSAAATKTAVSAKSVEVKGAANPTWKFTPEADATKVNSLGIVELGNAAGEGYDVMYLFNGSTTATAGALTGKYDTAKGGVAVTASTGNYLHLVAKATDSKTDPQYSSVVNLAGYKTQISTFTTFATAMGNVKIGGSGTAYYGQNDSVKAAVAAAEKTFKDAGYKESKLANGTETAWNAEIIAGEQAVVDTVAAVAKSEVEKLYAGVASTDGTVTKLTEANYNDAVKAIEKVSADYKANHDSDATNNVVKNGEVTYADNGTYAQAIDAALQAAKKATVKYAKADVDAAAAVTKALKEAKTGDEAKAAIEAYGQLSNAAKELVSSADVAAAQDVVTKAELKDAQDDAAVSKVKGKTVKAKAKKATKSSLKVVKSKSGAKSTFKKTSGNSKVKVYKSGKIVVKKGLKAGKKYTVKVKATVGTQTKTVKVVVKVAK